MRLCRAVRWLHDSVSVRAQGAIILGCIRDSEDIGKMPLGVKALGKERGIMQACDQGWLWVAHYGCT